MYVDKFLIGAHWHDPLRNRFMFGEGLPIVIYGKCEKSPLSRQ